MRGKMTLGSKLLVLFLAVGIIPFICMGIASLLKSGDALTDAAYEKLEAVQTNKTRQVEKYFQDRQSDLTALAEMVSSLREKAFEKLAVVQQIKKAQIEEFFRERMNDVAGLSRNPLVAQALQSFPEAIEEDGTIDEGLYGYFTMKFGDLLKEFRRVNGYEDILLVDTQGTVVFSATEGPDLTQNAVTGALKDSVLGRCLEKAGGGEAFQDFEPYGPADGRFISMIAAPVYRSDSISGETVSAGTLVFKMGKDPVNLVAQRREGMGRTGETFFVGRAGEQSTYRSDRTVKTGTLGEESSSPFLEALFSGESGIEAVLEKDGSLEITAYAPLDIPGAEWGVVSVMELEEAIAPRAEGEDGDFFSRYVTNYGYDDLLLIHPQGKVFYSVAHAADYGTNALDGPYRETALGATVKSALETGRFALSDFAPYKAAEDRSCAFTAQPVIQDGEAKLVVAVRIPHASLDSVVQERAGMGETGESYLVAKTGADTVYRTNRVIGQGKADETISNPFLEPALSGRSGLGRLAGEGGREELVYYGPVRADGLQWAMVTTMAEEEALAAVRGLTWLMGIVALAALISITAVALVLSRSITLPVKRIIAGLRDLAEGVSSGAHRISVSSSTLAEGATHQAASIEETSSSLEEMASMTRLNADHAGEADTLMKETNRVVEKASESMGQLTGSMSEISKASEKTSKIVKTIDEIAFQTNLLALNAAVEAARAGEAGAGFAVVADEVRSLALRAADAARNTADLIEETVRRVNEGESLVETTSQAFSDVSSNAGKVGGLVSEIAAASGEQARGIEQLNQAVTEMDRVTQQNAANAEVSAAAAETMDDQSDQMRGFVEELVDVVGGKGVRTGGHGSEEPPAPPALPSPSGKRLQPANRSLGELGMSDPGLSGGDEEDGRF